MPKPFGKIALSLSGGGVRAVGYHTGALSLLNHVAYDDGVGTRTLLEDVATISTVSGGTLVGMGYAADLKNGHSFGDFYQRLRDDMQSNYYFVRQLLNGLSTPHAPGPAGRRYLVSAYADLFRNRFHCFSNNQFEIFSVQNPDIHLEELIFNTVETYFGDGFRFHQGTLGGSSGSDRIELEEQYAQKALLADIMAASSDLPGVFTPIEFPDDFHWPRDREPEPFRFPRPDVGDIEVSINQEFQNNGGDPATRRFDLIDGGVYDNQGMSAIVSWLRSTNLITAGDAFRRLIRFDTLIPDATEADILKSRINTLNNVSDSISSNAERTTFWNRLNPRPTRGDPGAPGHQLSMMTDAESETEYGLFFVSDSPEYHGTGPIYATGDSEWVSRGKTKLRTIVWLTILGTVLGIAALAYIVWRLIAGPPFLANPSFWDYVFLGIALAVLFLVVVVAVFVLVKFWTAMGSVENANGSLWPGIRNLRIRSFRNMGWLRIKSVAAVLVDIMPNRIRHLGIDTILLDPLINEETVVISELTDFTKALHGGLPPWLNPTQAMVDLAEDMGSMSTRFWLTRPEFEQLVAIGQCTTCYNLLAQLMLRDTLYPRSGSADNPVFDNALHQAVFDACRTTWTELQANPLRHVP